jgi:anti-anti-sigma regulatory factor/HAMP domain-containing protein
MATIDVVLNPDLSAKLPVWRQIRWQLILAFVLLAVVPVVVVAQITSTLTRDQLVSQALSQLESIADLKRDQIAGWVNDSTAGLDLLASSPVRADLIALAQAVPPSKDTQARIDAFLQEATTQPGQAEHQSIRFQALFVYTPEGLIVAASDTSMVGRVVTRQPYFAASLSAEYVQPPYYVVGGDKLTMVITRRLRGADGRVAAVLGAQLDLSVLGQLMAARSGLGASGETYLVSRESNYLLTPSRFSGYELTRAYHSVGIDQALRGTDGRGVYSNYRDPPDTVMGVYRWVPELQAALLAETSQSEALAAADQVQWFSSIVMVGAILLAVLVGLVIATRISRPIGLLTRMAAQIAGGALDQRVQLAQRNEVGVLAAGFNGMAAQLQQTLQGLEQRVAERTVALQGALADLEARTAAQAELLAVLEQQRAVIRDLSVPVIPISATTLIMPLVGVLDTERLQQIQTQALEAIQRASATHTLILDITGVPIVDTHVAQGLLQVVDAARLLGARAVLVGIRPEVAQALVGLGVDMRAVRTFADLQGALSTAPTRRA